MLIQNFSNTCKNYVWQIGRRFVTPLINLRHVSRERFNFGLQFTTIRYVPAQQCSQACIEIESADKYHMKT